MGEILIDVRKSEEGGLVGTTENGIDVNLSLPFPMIGFSVDCQRKYAMAHLSMKDGWIEGLEKKYWEILLTHNIFY